VQSLVQVLFARDGQGADGAVLVDDGDPYGRGLADSFAEQFEERGGSVLLRERIKRGQTEFSSLVRQVLSAEPDVVVFQGFNPEGALIVRALREGGFAGTFIGPDGLLTGRDFVATAGEHAEGAVLTGGAIPDETFVGRFSERFGRAPATPFVLQAYDATTALLRAVASTANVESSGRLALDRERLGETLHAQRFDGLTGSISFDENGDRAGSTARELGLTIYRIGGGVPIALQ
jgi:branched-chain amino acid transport system substrate-binding protein